MPVSEHRKVTNNFGTLSSSAMPVSRTITQAKSVDLVSTKSNASKAPDKKPDKPNSSATTKKRKTGESDDSDEIFGESSEEEVIKPKKGSSTRNNVSKPGTTKSSPVKTSKTDNE